LLFGLWCLAHAVEFVNTESVSNGNNKAVPHKLSVCTMVNDEAAYVEEWVAYHLLLKIDHFYIYNDRSSDNITEVLAPYIKQGFVSLIHWNGNQTVSTSLVPSHPAYTRNQRFALADCVYNHQSESEWFGIWDVDEFLSMGDMYVDVQQFLSGYLANSNMDEYHIPMAIFGTSSHDTTPKGLVIENYQWRSNVTMFGMHPYSNKFTGKTLYKSGCAVPEVHLAPSLPAECRRDYAWTKFEGSTATVPIALNHYFSKSWSHFQQKMSKWHLGNANKEEFDQSTKFYSQYRDERLMKYTSPVKEFVSCMSQMMQWKV